MRLDGAMLFVRDLEGMAAFYAQTMGLRPNEGTRLGDWIEFDTGGAHFALHAIPNSRLGAEAGSPPPPREHHPYKLIFSVADLGAARARLKEAGVTILDRPWGGWDAVDPEGNVLGFRQIET